MKLLSVNVARPCVVHYRGKTITSDLFKRPVEGRVRLGARGLAGDGPADAVCHGGEHRAVAVYTAEDFVYWNRLLGRMDFTPGLVGENFTVAGMTDDEVCVGDIFRIGEALVQVSGPRPPCFALKVKVELATGWQEFQAAMLDSGRLGFYLRVLDQGTVGAGDRIECVTRYPERVSVRALSRLRYVDPADWEGMRRALRLPALAPDLAECFRLRLSRGAKDTEPAPFHGQTAEAWR